VSLDGKADAKGDAGGDGDCAPVTNGSGFAGAWVRLKAERRHDPVSTWQGTIHMKRFAVLLVSLFIWPAAPLPAEAGCYICTSGSSCGQYCRYGGRDTGAKRKGCRKAGCKIGGTASCPSGSNIRICSGLGFKLDRRNRHAAIDELLARGRPVEAPQSRAAR